MLVVGGHLLVEQQGRQVAVTDHIVKNVLPRCIRLDVLVVIVQEPLYLSPITLLDKRQIMCAANEAYDALEHISRFQTDHLRFEQVVDVEL